MPIRFACSNPSCGSRMRAADEQAGKKVMCPRCRTVQIVPAGLIPFQAPQEPQPVEGTRAQTSALPACPSSSDGPAPAAPGSEPQRGRKLAEDCLKAIAYGTVTASLVIEDFSLDRWQQVGYEDIEQRLQKLRKITHF